MPRAARAPNTSPEAVSGASTADRNPWPSIHSRAGAGAAEVLRAVEPRRPARSHRATGGGIGSGSTRMAGPPGTR